MSEGKKPNFIFQMKAEGVTLQICKLSGCIIEEKVNLPLSMITGKSPPTIRFTVLDMNSKCH